jgi:uncharacterized protein (UPF0276 family)
MILVARLSKLAAKCCLIWPTPRLAPFNMKWPSPRDYLAALPLAKVREIHINHPYNDNGKQMLDRHLPIGEADLDLLSWTLERTPNAEVITIESDMPDEAALSQEVALLRKFYPLKVG